MTQPTLSVLMPNYNHARFLRESINAVLDQSRRPDEFILIDDASTDDSLEIIEEFARREPLLQVIQHERNQGVVFCINQLLRSCSSDYFFFAAADDKALPGLFEKSMRLLSDYPEAAFCSSLVERISEQGEGMGLLPIPMVSERACYFTPQDVRGLLGKWGSWIQTFSTIYRKEAVGQAGGFDRELGSYCDSFLCEIMALQHGACFIPEWLMQWRKMPEGFASATAADGERACSYIQRAVAIISSENYKDLFPPGYAKHYRSRKLFALGFGTLERTREVVDHSLDQLSFALPEKHLLDHVGFGLARFFLRLWSCALSWYLLIRNADAAVLWSIASWLWWKSRRGSRTGYTTTPSRK